MSRKSMSMREAAEALGVSTDTIRRRIKAGSIRAEKVEGPFGPQWVIDPDTLANAQQILEVVPIKHNLEPAALEKLISQAAADAAKAGAAEAIREQAEQMQRLEDTIKALTEKLEKLEQEGNLSLFQRLTRRWSNGR